MVEQFAAAEGCITFSLLIRLFMAFAGLGDTKFELFCYMNMTLIKGLHCKAPVTLALLKALAFSCHYHLYRGETKGESYFIPGSASPLTVIISLYSCKLSTDLTRGEKKKKKKQRSKCQSE